MEVECQNCDHFERMMHGGNWTGFGECTWHSSVQLKTEDDRVTISRTPIVFKDCTCSEGVQTE